MPQSLSTPARFIAAMIAIAVFVSLAVQIVINQEPGQSPIATFGLMMRYFTIWTNLAAGLVMGWTAWRGRSVPRTMFALTTAIVIVAAVYHILLANEHDPVGADWCTNLMFHTLIPGAVTLWWLTFSRLSSLSWRSLSGVIVAPIIYGVFALINGAVTDFYAYFFLDLPALGWPQLLINIVGLSALFVIVGTVLLAVRGSAGKFQRS